MYNVNPGIMASIIKRRLSEPASYKLIDIINALELNTSLSLCLDAGDADSYPGSGQTWFDVSGNGNHYYRGTTSGAEATDPTFVGSAGDLSSSTYWSFDGGDRFTQSAAQTFAADWHKDNGAATGLFVFYPLATKAAVTLIWSNKQAAADAGMKFGIQTARTLRMTHSITTTTQATDLSATATLTGAVFNFMAIAIDEAAGTSLYRAGATSETGSFTASTDTDAITQNYSLGADPDGGNPCENGERLMACALWGRTLSDDELTSIYTYLKLRVSGMP